MMAGKREHLGPTLRPHVDKVDGQSVLPMLQCWNGGVRNQLFDHSEFYPDRAANFLILDLAAPEFLSDRFRPEAQLGRRLINRQEGLFVRVCLHLLENNP